jgi:hypothetical protein
MESPLPRRAPRERRCQKLIGALLLTSRPGERQRILEFRQGRLYQGSKLPHRDVIGAGSFWSVGAESERFQAPEAQDAAGD